MIHKAAEDEFRKDDVELTVAPDEPRPVLLIVMGPASCGKSTIGSELSEDLGIPFIDGDSLHPKSNVEKMTAGHPLTDDDRLPWLALIRSTAERVCKEEWESHRVPPASRGGPGRPAVIIACSALKKWYRDILRGGVAALPPAEDDLPASHPSSDPSASTLPATANLLTLFLYCHGSRSVLVSRISARKGHFMAPTMLDSQLAALEDPREEEGVCWVDIAAEKEEVRRKAEAEVRKLLGWVEREKEGEEVEMRSAGEGQKKEGASGAERA